jgi:TetR/AcrR family transcriptional regulator, mexJK operon transcriptional repressor
VGQTEERRPDPRVQRSRAAVLEAATALFLERGYVDTSTDDVAARAGVSKKTLYNTVGGKERLFTEVVLAVTATAERFADDLVAALREADDVAEALHALARRHLAAVTSPRVVRLRRLASAESRRFPELAREYHRRAPGRVVDALAAVLAGLDRRGRLRTPDARTAAEHLAFLVVGPTLDAVMFEGEAAVPDAAELDRRARAGVEAFLAAYGVRADAKASSARTAAGTSSGPVSGAGKGVRRS